MERNKSEQPSPYLAALFAGVIAFVVACVLGRFIYGSWSSAVPVAVVIGLFALLMSVVQARLRRYM